MRFVGLLAGGVDDEKEMIAAMGDHEVIENSAIRVGEQCIPLAAGLQAQEIDRHEPLQRRRGIRHAPGFGSHDDLTHVGNVEQARGGTRVQMLLENAWRIVNRHLIAGERHHARALRHMQRIERRAFQNRRGLGGTIVAHSGLHSSTALMDART